MSDRFEWVELSAGARWPAGPTGRLLLTKLNKVGRDLRHKVIITSGKRSPYEQWRAYQDYLRGGTLAARCCSKTWLHGWEHCGRQCASNHCVSRAADCLIETSEKGRVNIGEHPPARKAMRRHGLCLPVGSGETWHVEIGDTWRS